VRVTLPDGSSVLAQGRLGLVDSHRPITPGYAVYLDHRWADDPEVRWPCVLVEWPDFGLPSDEDGFFGVVDDLYRRARAGELVEVACYGGIGRTGTVLACLAVLAGIDDPGASVLWVRTNYHSSAVETSDQEALVRRFAERRST
jgi:hypothetical protein